MGRSQREEEGGVYSLEICSVCSDGAERVYRLSSPGGKAEDSSLEPLWGALEPSELESCRRRLHHTASFVVICHNNTK